MDTTTTPSRAHSADTGGVPLPLEAEQPAKQPSSSRNRRRPRKLNRDALPAADPSRSQSQSTHQQDDVVSTQLSELRGRVEDIERQVGDMLDKLGAKKGVSRRRMRKREGETEGMELERLRRDLVAANGELSALREQERRGGGGQDEEGGEEEVQDSLTVNKEVQGESQEQGKKEEVEEEEEEEIEEIPRTFPPPSPQQQHRTARPASRGVTFSGSYRLNLPQSVSATDIQAVQTGINGVQSIARKYIADTHSSVQATQSREVTTTSGTGWSSWLGGYSLSIARFVNGMHVDEGGATTATTTATNRQDESKRQNREKRKPTKLRVGAAAQRKRQQQNG